MMEGTVLSGLPIIHTIEMHTGGSPLRIVLSGYPPIKGKTILEKRRYVSEHLDHLRTMLMSEPRGHLEMNGVILVEKDCCQADLAILIMHSAGYSTMCGDAVIALGRYAIDYNLVKPVSPVTRVNIQCPCGLIPAYVQCREGKSGDVHFESVPSFAFATDLKISLEDVGEVQCDIAYGGNFFVFVDARELGVNLKTTPVAHLRNLALAVRKAVMANVTLTHPLSCDLAIMCGTIITSDSSGETQQLCVVTSGQINRSPCGSGVCAKVALQYHKGKLQLGQEQTFVNPKVGSKFTGQPLRVEPVGCYGDAVVVKVGGHAWYVGEGKWRVEAGDELTGGFLVE